MILKTLKTTVNLFVSIAKGLRVTLFNWSILRPGVTELYPEEKPTLPKAFRGMPVLICNPETGQRQCVACGACARICPEQIIIVEADASDHKNRKPKKFEIDVSRCLFCGLCVEVCPTKGLIHTDNFELACVDRKGMIYDYSLPCTPEIKEIQNIEDSQTNTEDKAPEEETNKEGEQS